MIYSGSVPTLHLHPLPKLLLGNSNPLYFVFNPNTTVENSDTSYPKLVHLFPGYKPTQYTPISGSDQPFLVLETLQNKNNYSQDKISLEHK